MSRRWRRSLLRTTQCGLDEMAVKRRILAVILLSTQILVGCGERRESAFASVKDARSSGEIARGWVPSDLPDSFMDLRELYDLDTDEVWGTFRIPSSERASAITLTRVEMSKVNGHSVRSPGVNWWPEILSGNLDGHVLEDSGFEIYGSAAPVRFWIAINRTEGRGFFWSGSS